MVGRGLAPAILLLALGVATVVVFLHSQTAALHTPLSASLPSPSSAAPISPILQASLGRCGPVIRDGTAVVGTPIYVAQGNRSSDKCRRLCLGTAACTSWSSSEQECKLFKTGRLAVDRSVKASGSCDPVEVWDESGPPTEEINCNANPSPTKQSTPGGSHILSWNESQQQLPSADRKAVCESLRPIARDRLVVVIAANKAFMDMAKACLCSLIAVGRTESVVLSLDPFVFSELTRDGYPSIPNPAGFPGSGSAKYRSKAYVLITLLKFRGVYYLLRWGYRVLFSDSDVVYFSDPLPHIPMTTPLAFTIDDPIISMTQVTAHCSDPAPVWKKLGWACTGIYYAHDSPTTRYIYEWADSFALSMQMKRRGKGRKILVHDQAGVNVALRGAPASVLRDISSINRCLFANGNFYFKLRIPQKFNVTPVAVHANYLTVSEKRKFLSAMQRQRNCTSSPLPKQHELLHAVHAHFNKTSELPAPHWIVDLYKSARHLSKLVYDLAVEKTMQDLWG